MPGRCGDEFSAGCNKLIATNKAALITSADDLLAAMRWEGASARQPQQLALFPDLSKEEQAVVDVIRDHGEIHLNALADVLQQPVYKLMSTLVELDCRKVIVTLPGCRYTLM